MRIEIVKGKAGESFTKGKILFQGDGNDAKG